MKRQNEKLDILAIGLDPHSIEMIKNSLKDNQVKYKISFLQEVSELASFNRKTAQAVFIFSNRQNQQTIQDIRKVHLEIPGAAITLISPRSDHHGVIGAFRAGLFDLLTLPLDSDEIRTVIYRLKLHGAIQSGQWNPERAVLHLFSRPESFSSVSDIGLGLNQYLNLFLKVENEVKYHSGLELLSSLQIKFPLSERQVKKIKTFIADETGLIFGIRFINERFHFLVKNGDSSFSLLCVKNISDFPIKDILSDYLANVLRTSLSILTSSQKREEIRLLSLTDEVTGLFNQRKLIEDLEFYIARYEHDKTGFSLLFIDIDYFKNVNDQFGHVVGSQLLNDMSVILKGQLRSNELVYRYGGDEFIVLLPKTSVEETKKIALRISQAVKKAEFAVDHDMKYRLSLSVGIASYPNDADSAKSIIEFADKMMYMSKKSGRGKVFHVTEVVE
jgi:diguanylate cyclase (GGDEF)-like protein